MQKVNWNGLMKVLEIRHFNAAGELLWEKFDIRNMLHNTGELFLLQSLFLGGPTDNPYIPTSYYLGLDNRDTILAEDTMDEINGEPSTNSYVRQAVSSTTGFSLAVNSNNNYRASTSIVTFRAIGGSWGPVQNIFLTDKIDITGKLISSSNLGNPFSLASGDTISLRMGLSLRDCPSV